MEEEEEEEAFIKKRKQQHSDFCLVTVIQNSVEISLRQTQTCLCEFLVCVDGSHNGDCDIWPGFPEVICHFLK